MLIFIIIMAARIARIYSAECCGPGIADPMVRRTAAPLITTARSGSNQGILTHMRLNACLTGFNRCKSADRASGYRPVCVLKSAMGYHAISYRVLAVPPAPDSLTEDSPVHSVHAVMGAMHGSQNLRFGVLAADLDSDPNSQ
jgi:hypothetical protein